MKNEQFKEWFLISDYREIISIKMKLKIGESITEQFYKLPFSMQWGVYLEFFDSVGIYIDMDCHDTDEGFYFYIGNHSEYAGLVYPTRQEAQQEAIKKAFELLPE